MDNYSHSRLAQREIRRNNRKALLYILLTLGFFVMLFFLGIPALIKLAIFLGDLKSSGTPVETQELVPPSPPSFKPIPPATNNNHITVEGFGEPGATVEIFVSESSGGSVVAENDGSFKFNNITLTTGMNEIYAKVTDNTGQISGPSGKLKIVYNNTAPDLEITEPADGSRYNVSKTKIAIKGKTSPEATLTINDHLIILSSDGSYNYNFALSSGENKVKVVATDSAGNKTEKEITLYKD